MRFTIPSTSWLAAVVIVLTLAANTLAQPIPRGLNVQGVLRNTSGEVVGGTYSITFRLFTAQAGGTKFWEETKSLPVIGGYFNAYLGPFGSNLFKDKTQAWLEVQVGADAAMPRQAVTSTGYAFVAEHAVMSDALTGGSIRGVVQLFGTDEGAALIESNSSYQVVSKTLYNRLEDLFNASALPGTTREYYLGVRKADNIDACGTETQWRFWFSWVNKNGHAFTVGRDWGDINEGTWRWVQVPTVAAQATAAGADPPYWRLEARMPAGCSASYKMKVFGIFAVAVDRPSGTTVAVSLASGAAAGGATYTFGGIGSNLQVTPNGNVGVGVAPDPAYRFDVNGGVRSRSGGFTFPDGTTQATAATTTAQYWTQSGSNLYASSAGWNVGIGNTAPAQRLHVTGGGIFDTSGTGGSRVLNLKAAGTGEVSYGVYPWEWSSALQIQSNNTQRFLWLNAGAGDGSQYAQLRAAATGIDFRTGGGTADTGNLALRLNPSGIVNISPSAGTAIGTESSPDATLQVVGHVHVGNQTAFDNPGGWGKTVVLDGLYHSRIRLKGSNHTYGAVEAHLWADSSVSPPAGVGTVTSHSFAVQTGGTARLIVDTAGRVGIGTTPSEKLDVAGGVRAAGPVQGTSIQGNNHITHLPWFNMGDGPNGYIKLVTPIVDNESNMFSIKIFGYLYGYEGGRPIEIRCGGYAYSGLPTGSALIAKYCDAEGPSSLPVELATENRGGVNKVVIRLGTPTTDWHFDHFTAEYVGWAQKDASGFSWVTGETSPAPGGNINQVVIDDQAGSGKFNSITLGGVSRSSWPGGGAGTAGRLARWTSGTDLGNSVFYDDGSKVGLGTTSPAYTLDVNGDLRANGMILVRDQRVIDTDASYIHVGDLASGDGMRALILRAGDQPRIYADQNGNVGIGTLSPPYKLYAEGDIGAGPGRYLIARYTSNETYRGELSWSGLQLGNNGPNYIVAGRTNPNGTLYFYTNNTNDYTYANPNGNLAMTLTAAGNVGIRRGDAYNALHVSGAIGATSWVGAGCETSCDTNGSYSLMYEDGRGVFTRSVAIGSGSDPGAGRLYVTDRIGVGTASPSYNLHVTGSASLGQTYFTNSDIYFTNTGHDHTGIGNCTGCAALENASNYGALMILGRHNGSARIVKLWDYLQVNGNLDVTGTVTGAGTAFIQTVNRSSYLVISGANSWQDIPGLSITVSLGRSARVQMIATGELRTPNENPQYCHIGFRYVVDGSPRGDGTWGQRIQVSRGDLSWWTTWSISDWVDFGAGTHTVTLQANGPGYGGCVVCGEVGPWASGYSDCNLTLHGVYQ